MAVRLTSLHVLEGHLDTLVCEVAVLSVLLRYFWNYCLVGLWEFFIFCVNASPLSDPIRLWIRDAPQN